MKFIRCLGLFCSSLDLEVLKVMFMRQKDRLNAYNDLYCACHGD